MTYNTWTIYNDSLLEYYFYRNYAWKELVWVFNWLIDISPFPQMEKKERLGKYTTANTGAHNRGRPNGNRHLLGGRGWDMTAGCWTAEPCTQFIESTIQDKWGECTLYFWERLEHFLPTTRLRDGDSVKPEGTSNAKLPQQKNDLFAFVHLLLQQRTLLFLLFSFDFLFPVLIFSVKKDFPTNIFNCAEIQAYWIYFSLFLHPADFCYKLDYIEFYYLLTHDATLY